MNATIGTLPKPPERLQRTQSQKWMWYILPGQITNQGLNIVIPLYVIALGGGIGQVALIVALQNAAIAIGSIFWGKIIDRFHSRRFILLVSFLAVLLCSVAIYFTNSIVALYAIAPALGFFIVGRNPVTQLLVMESVQKNMWSWLFARTSVISTLGMLVAMAVGTIDSVYFDLKPYFLICAAPLEAAQPPGQGRGLPSRAEQCCTFAPRPFLHHKPLPL